MACLPGRKKSRGAAGGDFPMEQQLEHLFPELLRKVWDHLGSTRQVIAAVTPVSKALRDAVGLEGSAGALCNVRCNVICNVSCESDVR